MFFITFCTELLLPLLPDINIFRCEAKGYELSLDIAQMISLKLDFAIFCCSAACKFAFQRFGKFFQVDFVFLHAFDKGIFLAELLLYDFHGNPLILFSQVFKGHQVFR